MKLLVDTETTGAENFYRAVGEPDYHGFPSPSPWDELANMLRSRGLFTYFREIEKDLGRGRVLVRGGGEMIMLCGYSYLGLNKRPEIAKACNDAINVYGTGTHGSRWLAGHTSLHARFSALSTPVRGI